MFFLFLALFVGLYFALHFSDYAEKKINGEFSVDQLYVSPIAFCLTFLAVGAMVYFLGQALQKVVKLTPLTLLNHLAGALFSMLKFALFILAGILFINSMLERKGSDIPAWQKDSIIYPPLSQVGELVLPNLTNSTLSIANLLKEEQAETGLTAKEILEARQRAKEMEEEVENIEQLKKIHDTP